MKNDLSILPANSRICDYSYAKPAIEWIIQQGFKCAIRYIGGNPTKRLTIEEIETLHWNGVGILLIWEDTTTKALGGSYAGSLDGLEAVREAKALGYCAGGTIVTAIDFNVVSLNLQQVINYCAAFNMQVVAGGYNFGIYGDADIIQKYDEKYPGQSKINWLAGATSWSNYKIPPITHVQQYPQVGIIDPNTTLKEIEIWQPNLNGLCPL